MQEKILAVDDDLYILESYKRSLRGKFEIDTASSGAEGLEKAEKNGPYAVIVSDLKMPEMDGIHFLSSVARISPQSVRIMLTGNAELQTAIDAVNEGQIFRFLTKPCMPALFAKALQAGIDQYRLVVAEHELLEKTLSGSVKVLIEAVSLASSCLFGRASRLRKTMTRLAIQMNLDQTWEFELAGMLSQIGCVSLPDDILEEIAKGHKLPEDERVMFETHPQIGAELISSIPRLKPVADIIAYQEKNFDGSGVPRDDLKEDAIPLGARALHVAIGYDVSVTSGMDSRIALSLLKQRPDLYDPDIVGSLTEVVSAEIYHEIRKIALDDLETTMILAQDIRTMAGLLVIPKGQEVTPSMKARLKNFRSTMKIAEPIFVMVP